jgi:hypothetical protein
MADKDRPSTWENVGKGFGSAFSKAGPVIIVLGLGAVGIYFLYQWLMEGFFGKANAFKDALQQALDNYTKKMISFNQETNGNLTASQLSASESELHAIDGLSVQLAAAYSSWDQLVNTFSILMYGVTAGAFTLVVLDKYLKGGFLHKPGTPAPDNIKTPSTAYGNTMLVNMMIADEMIAMGDTIGATNLMNTMQSYYSVAMQGQMETQITNIQTEINAGLLQGVQLFIAQQTIAALSYDMALMPTLLVFPMVILP